MLCQKRLNRVDMEMNKHYVLHFLELGFVLFLLSYVVVGHIRSSEELSRSTQEPPPPFSNELDTIQDLEKDLQNLGCNVVYLKQYDWSVSNAFHVANYTEFRKVAYISKLVFLYGHGQESVFLFAIVSEALVELSFDLPITLA